MFNITVLTDLHVLVSIALIAVLGIALLWLATMKRLEKRPGLRSVVRNLGALLFASVTVSILWDVALKRAFLVEVMELVQVRQDIAHTGLTGITGDFRQYSHWNEHFKDVEELDIFFMYGRTWRRNNETQLRTLAQKPEATVRVILPDPDNDDLMLELSRWFNTDKDDMRARVVEAVNEFQGIFGESTPARFSLWYLSTHPVFSFYRFDDVTVMAFYTHRRERAVPVPALTLESGGSLDRFVSDELEALIGPNGLARKVYPPGEGG